MSLYSKTREERARGVPTKENEVVYGTFFFANATGEPSPGSKCFLNQKRTHDLSFLARCTIHHFRGASTSRLASFPLPCFNRPLGVRDGSLLPQPGSQSCLKSTCKQFGSQADFEVNYPETHLFFKFKRSFYEVEASKSGFGPLPSILRRLWLTTCNFAWN